MLDPKMKTLLVVAHADSYTQAAERLHLTQPAVSHHIKALETEYGISIFVKDRRPLEFTREGKLLYQYARRVNEMEKQLYQAISDSRSQKDHIQIGITQTAGEGIIPKMIAQYGKDNPKTLIKIYTDSIKNLYRRLDDYKLDVIIAEWPTVSEAYRFILLDTDYLSLVVSPRHPFAQRGMVKLTELKRENLILRSSSSSTRTLFESYLISEGEAISGFHVNMEIDNIATIKELVAMNYGVTIIAQSACRSEVKSGKLVPVTIENARMSRNINMIYKDNFENTQVLDDMRRIYREILQDIDLLD